MWPRVRSIVNSTSLSGGMPGKLYGKTFENFLTTLTSPTVNSLSPSLSIADIRKPTLLLNCKIHRACNSDTTRCRGLLLVTGNLNSSPPSFKKTTSFPKQ